MTVLIAGSHGFLGYSLARRLLEAGHEVIGLDKMRDAISAKGPRVEILQRYAKYRFIDHNLADQNGTIEIFLREQFQHAVFLAGQYSETYSREHVNRCMQGNVLGLTNFFEAAAAKKLKRVVYATSTFVQDGVLPKTMYGATKQWAELCASVYNAQFGMETIGIRFGSTYGPHVRPDVGIAWVARHVAKGAPLDVTRGMFTYKVAFLYADDAAEVLVRAIEQPAKQPYQVLTAVAEDDTHDMYEIMELVGKYMGKQPKILGHRSDSGPASVPSAVCAQMREALGYAPSTKMEDGVREFVKWYTGPIGS